MATLAQLIAAGVPAGVTPGQAAIMNAILNPPVYRYWRLRITANDGDGSYVSMSYFALFDGATSLTETYATSSSQYTASSSIGDAPFSLRTTADDNGSEWVGSLPLPQWVAFDLGAPRSVTGYRVKSQRSVPRRTPTAWTLQANNSSALNDAPWVTQHAVTSSTGWAALEQRNFAI